MKKHLLVTISNDVNNLFGVRFLCSFFSQISDNLVTLLHVCRLDDNDMARTLNQMWRDQDPDCVVCPQATKPIERAKQLLSEHNMSIENVITKTFAERYGKVKDILSEGSKGLYDAIVLGRRASYTLQWMVERPGDETAHAIIKDNCCTTPLWICPELELSRKNVLLCVDGSDNAYRAVDHAGYILADQEHQQVTLFNVQNGGAKAAEIFHRAETLLHEHGIGSDRIKRKSTWGLTVAGTIQSEVEKGGYAAVIVGLHGERGKDENKHLAGETTTKLISKVEKAALWCCP